MKGCCRKNFKLEKESYSHDLLDKHSSNTQEKCSKIGIKHSGHRERIGRGQRDESRAVLLALGKMLIRIYLASSQSERLDLLWGSFLTGQDPNQAPTTLSRNLSKKQEIEILGSSFSAFLGTIVGNEIRSRARL